MLSVSALTDRRRRQFDVGFTLIELLFVVVVIGTLAAIAIPVFLGIQKNALDSSAKAWRVASSGSAVPATR